MKLIKTYLIIITILSFDCCTNNEEFNVTNPKVLGKWEGDGNFYNVNLAAEIGSLKFIIEIEDDTTITGSAGDADFYDISIENDVNEIEIFAKLKSKVKKTHDLDKDHIIVMGHLKEDKIVGTFHLKTILFLIFQCDLVDSLYTEAKKNNS
jgi:hypothetical protein